MTENRKIKKVFKSKPTKESAGVHLRRVFGNSEAALFDPFLMLDDFRNTDPHKYIKGFPELNRKTGKDYNKYLN